MANLRRRSGEAGPVQERPAGPVQEQPTAPTEQEAGPDPVTPREPQREPSRGEWARAYKAQRAAEAKQEAIKKTHGRIGFDERETLMAFLLRNPTVFEAAREILTPEHFTDPFEIIYQVTWRSALDLYDQFERLPAYTMLEAEAFFRIESHPGEIPDEGKELRKFLRYAFHEIEAETINRTNYGFELLAKFLKERHWLDPLKKQLDEYGNDVPVAAKDLVSDIEQRWEAVASIGRTSTMETPDELEEIEDEGEQYLIDRLIPVKGVTYIVGPEKTRKTTGAGAELAAGLGTGTPVFGGRFQVARPCKVWYISAETRRGPMRSVLKRACHARGVTLRQSGIYLDCKPPAILTPEYIRQGALRHGIKVIVADSEYKLFGLTDTDQKDAASYAAKIDPMKRRSR